MSTGEGMPSNSGSAIRAHADKLIDELMAANPPAPNGAAAALAAGMPTFSKGTAVLDPDTGQPIVPKGQEALPGFATEKVPLADGATSAEPVAPIGAAGKTAEELLAEHQQRIAAAPEGVAPTATPAGTEAPAPATQAAGAAAAEAAATDIWADAEEFTFDDPDLGVPIPMRVPKQYATPAKRGYQRRSTFDRERQWLRNAEQVLGPLVMDGRINPILPMLQAALNDPDGYGKFVVDAFGRYQRGEPLLEQARAEAAAAGVHPVPAATPGYDPALADPFLAEQLAPVQTQLQTVQQRLEAVERERQTAAEAQRRQQSENQRIANEMIAAHRDLASRYPDRVRLDLGPQDPFWVAAVNQARDARYADQWGIRAGIIFGADKVVEIEQERIAATSSPAATALASMDSRAQELARQQAAASSRAVGAGAPTQAPPPPVPVRPSPRGPDGKLKPADQYLRESQAYIAATGAVPA